MRKHLYISALTALLAFGTGVVAAESTAKDSIISMDGGHEIFMDKRSPEDRIIMMDEGEEV